MTANSNYFIFDIETGPLPDDQLRELMPEFVAPEHPGEFDPSTVKTGNLKDPAKINEKIEQARQDHRKACDQYQGLRDLAEKQHFEDFKSKAALDATTGRVLAIGYLGANGEDDYYLDCLLNYTSREEEQLLNTFWKNCVIGHKHNGTAIGHNIIGFDLPFLIRRSWILSVDVPAFVIDANYRYFSKFFVDTLEVWKLGQYQMMPGSGKLDRIAKAMSCEGKLDAKASDGTEVNGANFAKLYFNSLEDRELALKYLLQDLQATESVARKLGLI